MDNELFTYVKQPTLLSKFAKHVGILSAVVGAWDIGSDIHRYGGLNARSAVAIGFDVLGLAAGIGLAAITVSNPIAIGGLFLLSCAADYGIDRVKDAAEEKMR